eukprot:MONOS_9114.1-p1 / transcript=MONOS_9114.1 / gene=MONOS_9114 / organism=Monocercomonoides_exilis_PA203 / gene_product=unspecified product / transcript_product=unspecified product / location=Mono_scaffold00366:735-1860(-) / protein_length=268 / sequence_SO=supercontig / SO=protein_coding / is_pseudo=false
MEESENEVPSDDDQEIQLESRVDSKESGKRTRHQRQLKAESKSTLDGNEETDQNQDQSEESLDEYYPIKRFRSYIIPELPLWQRFMAHFVRELLSNPNTTPFSAPVDPVRSGAKNYFDIVENPRDLGTIRVQIEKGEYKHFEEITNDITLVWENCRKYNPKTHPLYSLANKMETHTRKKLDALPLFVKEERNEVTDEEVASLPQRTRDLVKRMKVEIQRSMKTQNSAHAKNDKENEQTTKVKKEEDEENSRIEMDSDQAERSAENIGG